MAIANVLSYEKSEKYNYVYKSIFVMKGKYKKEKYRAFLNRRPKYDKCFDTEREAAIAIDKELIKRGEEPINILKKK